jgi:hypothetical protein
MVMGFPSRRRNDGIHIINLGKTYEKMLLAARVIVAIENPQDIAVLSARPYGQRAILKFAAYTGAKALAGRHTPGAHTELVLVLCECLSVSVCVRARQKHAHQESERDGGESTRGRHTLTHTHTQRERERERERETDGGKKRALDGGRERVRGTGHVGSAVCLGLPPERDAVHGTECCGICEQCSWKTKRDWCACPSH